MVNHRDPFPEGDTLYSYRRRIEEEESRLRAAVEEHLIRKARLEKAKSVLQGTAQLNASSPMVEVLNAAPSARTYVMLPAKMAAQFDSLKYRWWRIELHSSDISLPIIGLDVIEDVIIGRGGDPSTNIDLDLEPYGASRHGVSRQHTLLRPTPNNLYMTDLGSTNGTRYNGARLATEAIYSLNHNDVISFGNLVFQIKVLRAPNQV